MRLLTCGSRLEIPTEVIQQFDGVVGGYFWNLWGNPTIKSIAQKYDKTEIWQNFLYGNRHKVPDISSGCKTIEEWIAKRVKTCDHVTHWVLINEFTDTNGNPYPMYEYEKIKSYLSIAHAVNPKAKLIIGDFRPHLLKRWGKIKELCEQLLDDEVPLHGIGIQCHFKTTNAHAPIPITTYLLDGLPVVIESFKDVLPVHLIEVSGWRHYTEPPEKLIPLWEDVLGIATQSGVESFCPWWLNQFDEDYPRKMPSFEEFVGSGIYDKDWKPMLNLPQNNSL